MSAEQAQSTEQTEGTGQTEGNEQTKSVDAPTAPAVPPVEVLGDASPEQVAALVAVLSGLGGGDDEEPAGPPSRWSDRARLVRTAVHPSRGGWRASGLPR